MNEKIKERLAAGYAREIGIEGGPVFDFKQALADIEKLLGDPGIYEPEEDLLGFISRAMYERPDKAYPISSHPWKEVSPMVKTRYRRQAVAAVAAYERWHRDH